MSTPRLRRLVALLALCVALELAAARIPPSERKFTSAAVDAAIDSVSARLRDPQIAALFVNAYPNTLDTTVSNFTNADADGWPDTFIITGDINAQWLRDSANQVLPYLPFARPEVDPRLHKLACGLVNRQARDVLHDPFANSFNYADTGGQHKDDQRTPPMTPHVFEGKYELDSLAAFLKLSYGVYNWTQDFSCVRPDRWLKAVALVVQTITTMQAATAEDYAAPPYLFARTTSAATDTLMMSGHGPVARRCGLSKCMFRPSDDAVSLPFLIPANAMAVVELRHAAHMCADAASPVHDAALAAAATALADEIDRAIQTYGIATRQVVSFESTATASAATASSTQETVYAYEVDGFGAQTFMDDANVPSLLSLPLLGYVDRADAVYAATRALVLSPRNPFYFSGTAGEGIGGPHVGMFYVWPMSIIVRALTATGDDEIAHCLDMLKSTTAGTYFVHESFDRNNAANFTRKWFAWANALFGELILTLARERPHLIF